jgi:hypothetical protein
MYTRRLRHVARNLAERLSGRLVRQGLVVDDSGLGDIVVRVADIVE